MGAQVLTPSAVGCCSTGDDCSLNVIAEPFGQTLKGAGAPQFGPQAQLRDMVVKVEATEPQDAEQVEASIDETAELPYEAEDSSPGPAR